MPSIELRRAFEPGSVFLAMLVCATPCVVTAANTAPTISGSAPKSVAAGNAYFFKPAASDSDGDTLKFSIVNKPDWLAFSPRTGTLSGTPTKSNVGVFPDIRIRVTDSIASRSLDGFSIAVSTASASTSKNSAPKISGKPASTAVVGQAYSFRPTASDANGDRLKFMVKNKPGWAAFSSSTGRLSGTPSSSSVGSLTNIVITASDGKVSSSLPAFTIDVAAAPSDGEVGLTWSAPTRNSDGTVVNDLSGYRVYYGQSPGAYSRTLWLPHPSLTSVVIENLATGKWYFAVRALTSDGHEGKFSMQGWKYVE
jgi:hypothetical protein